MRWTRRAINIAAQLIVAAVWCASLDIAEAIVSAEVHRRFDDLSAEPVASDPDASARFMAEEVARWRAVIKTAGVTLE
jgi:tripartite-type tricarboxylate transporter receptor subunit TctC